MSNGRHLGAGPNVLWHAWPMPSLGTPTIGVPTILPAQDHFETEKHARLTHQTGRRRARMEPDSPSVPTAAVRLPTRGGGARTGVAARRRHKRCRGLEREENKPHVVPRTVDAPGARRRSSRNRGETDPRTGDRGFACD
ncbi:hypothetical protein [Kibdelosporangium philippinense]|uniref:hypothetical protein n=1 Tax=Kibdelosporangium philippinense TaxID=211113 RepID=UPI00360DB5FC